MRFLVHFIIYAVVIAGYSSCNSSSESKKLTIAVAANMQFAMDSLAHEFEKKTGVKCEFVLGSSGKLATQIIAGAPFDVFLSADEKYPFLVQKELSLAEGAQCYALGTLVMWSIHENLPMIVDSLVEDKVKHIAIANPEIAPYGIVAFNYLKSLPNWKELEPKLVYGESIGQVNQFVLSQSVEMGFTSKSSVMSNQLITKGNWISIANLEPIKQYGLVLSKENENANSFFDFIRSNQGAEILNEFGYDIP